jgi:hypothetical protein
VKGIKSLALFSVVFLLSLSFFSSAFARSDQFDPTVKALIDNQTDETIRLSLSGPVSTVIKVSPGKSKVSLEPGVYSYSYHACSQNYKGTFILQQAGDSLRFPACPGGGTVGQTGNAKLTIENRTTEIFTITLTGPYSYKFTVPPGNLRVEILPGKYTYSLIACGREIKGKLNTKTSLNTITVPKCKVGGQDDGEEQGKTVTFLIHNKTSGPIFFTLVDKAGKITKIVAKPGKTRLQVLAGKYSWTMSTSGCGTYETDSGIIDLTRSAIWDWYCSK